MQLTIFDQPTGAQLRDAGIKQAVDHANDVHESWSDQAYRFLLVYVCEHSEPFLCEDVRAAAEGIVPEPPSKRAWGGSVTRASNAGLITCIGTKKVKNPQAHCTKANLWQRN